MESSSASVTRTEARSAIAAVTQTAINTQTFPPVYPSTTKVALAPTANAVRANT
jgi:hypothetical protein